MVFDNSVINLVEDIQRFTYRNQAAIRIPKEWRERAWIQEVDIKISSIAREEFLNFRSNPANGFYGYAILVMRDHCEIEVPISLPRQRLYYGVVYDAFTNYYQLYYNYVTSRQLKFIAENLLVPIGQQLGLQVTSAPPECPVQPLWIELPLREIYIKCPNGTQFDVEFSRRRLVEPLVLGNCSYDGKSGMEDGVKDSGLPPNGIAPNRANDPANPFDGLRPATPIEELGEWFNNKGDTLNNVDPTNLPKEPPFFGGQCIGISYSIRIEGTLTTSTGSFQTFTQTLGFPLFRFVVGSIEAVIPIIVLSPSSGTVASIRIISSSGNVTRDIFLSSITPNTPVTITQVDIVRLDGQPDTCGDPPIIFD